MTKKSKKKITASKKTLLNLYKKEKKSVFDLAKIFHCHHSTIYEWMKKAGISVRMKRIRVSGGELEKMYLNGGKSTIEIAKKLKCSSSAISYKLRKFQISKSPSLARNRYEKFNFSKDLAEKSYLIGFRVGDLWVHKTNVKSETIFVSCHTTCNDQIILMKKLFSRYGKVSITFNEKDRSFSVNCYLDATFSFLLPKEDLIDKWILHKRSYVASFIAGYIDAEGSFSVNQNRGRFKIDSYDKNILNQAHEWFLRNKIRSKLNLIYKKGEIHQGMVVYNNDLWRLNVNEVNSLLEFIKIFKPLLRHKKRLQDLLKCERNVVSRINKKI